MKTTPEKNDELEEFFSELSRARNSERLIKEWRIRCENQIAALIEGPESGSKTVTLESGRKITVKRGVNYSADIGGMMKIKEICLPIQAKSTTSLNIEGYEWYKKNDPVAFATISEFVETKPKKVAVTIKEKKEE
ncbi:hypothetical protein LCGC14_2570630 [marine sediment metagenome]|uniref:Uncharacterized protein n=1 Tax=marine sediment metagenome TaxID=412755 RepID=A0A0F9B574_9ZZZZ